MKKFVALALILSFGMLVAGCGNPAPTKKSEDKPPVTNPPPADKPAPGK